MAKRKGIALGTLLCLCPILVMMVVVAVRAVRSQHAVTKASYDDNSALYMAEAGLARTIARLEQNAAWRDGYAKEPLEGVDGYYTVLFHKPGGGPPKKDQSVSNLDGQDPDSWRGENTVPPGCVDIVVTGYAGSGRRTVEALVRMGGGLPLVEQPMITSGRIHLEGDVRVWGHKANWDHTPVNVSVHSNLASGEDAIVWDGKGTWSSSANATTVSSHENAVSEELADKSERGVMERNIPHTDVVKIVEEKESAGYRPVIPSSTSITLKSSNYYNSGDLVVNGDLNLNGGRLYVKGNLRVSGTIRGSGSIFVAGETTFQGDSQISSASPDKIALYSHGSVQLKGFDGYGYLERLASATGSDDDGNTFPLHPALKMNFERVQNLMTNFKNQLDSADNNKFNQWGTTGSLQRTRRDLQDALSDLRYETSRLHDGSSTADALIGTLGNLRKLFDEVPPGQEATVRNRLRRGEVPAGGFAALLQDGALSDEDREAYRALGLSTMDSIGYSKLGNSYFQGLVYTHGSFFADNAVSITGAIAVDGDSSLPKKRIDSDHELAPGDLFLRNGASLHYIQDFFKTSVSGNEPSKILIWMGR